MGEGAPGAPGGALCSVRGNGILSRDVPAFASYRRAGKISGADRDRTGGRCSGGKDSQGGGAPDPGGQGYRRQRPELPGEREGPSSGRDRRPLPDRGFRNGGQAGAISADAAPALLPSFPCGIFG